MQELYDYSAIIERPQLILPNEARVAVWVGLNIEHYELGKPSTSIFSGTANLNPDPLNYGQCTIATDRKINILQEY